MILFLKFKMPVRGMQELTAQPASTMGKLKALQTTDRPARAWPK